MKPKSKIESLNRVKYLVGEFAKEIERVESYANATGGVIKLWSSMEEIMQLQDSLEPKLSMFDV